MWFVFFFMEGVVVSVIWNWKSVFAVKVRLHPPWSFYRQNWTCKSSWVQRVSHKTKTSKNRHLDKQYHEFIWLIDIKFHISLSIDLPSPKYFSPQYLHLDFLLFPCFFFSHLYRRKSLHLYYNFNISMHDIRVFSFFHGLTHLSHLLPCSSIIASVPFCFLTINWWKLWNME